MPEREQESADRKVEALDEDYFDQWSSQYGAFYTPDARIDREFRLSRMLVLAGRSWQHRIDNILRNETGQTRARWQALFALAFAPQPATMSELCKRVRVQWPTMVRLLDAMDRDGLIRREENPADGRSRLVYLTEHGEEVMRQIQPILDRERSRILRHLSDEELETCAEMLHRIFEDAINL